MNYWQHIPEHINPNIIEIGSFQIRYYGLMYLIAFITTYLLVLHRLKNEGYEYSKTVIQKYFIWAVLGIMLGGRLGNFLNGELYGRVTSSVLGMYFPLDLTGQLRHPSQLYEAFFEGIFLFRILWSLRKKRPFDGFHFCLYIISYAIVRFCIEFVREPNPGLGSIRNYFTMGQLLSIAMVLGGVLVMITQMVNAKSKIINSK